MLTSRPRGTTDLLPGEVEKWQFLEGEFRSLCHDFGFGEVRTPVFEHTELFQRAVGESTDIVRKEMYTFEDRGGRSVTLRPEGTAPTVRAYLQNKLYAEPQPTKLYYVCPIFRYERPQSGRLRQHHQFGVEMFGAASSEADVEVIMVAWEFFRRLGLGGLVVHLNSIGCVVCRPSYREALRDFFRAKMNDLCADCRQRYELNPLRILDCKVKSCQLHIKEAPHISDYLCDDCQRHFEDVKSLLLRRKVDFVLDGRLVRGLDYYTRTVFEIRHSRLGAQNSICSGGRYDGLVEECGGDPAPGVGFGMGVERLIEALELEGAALPARRSISVYIAISEAGDWEMKNRGLDLLYDLREKRISADMDYLGRSLKSQMKYANKAGARYVVILGREELAAGEVVLRDMARRIEQRVPLFGVPEMLQAGGPGDG